MMNSFNIPESRNETPRPSKQSLEKIKEHSDENLEIIIKKMDTKCGNEKRDLIVNMISALDYYIHDIIIWGITEITMNQFPKGKNYEKFEISIKYIQRTYAGNDIIEEELKFEIIKKLSYETYQKWNSIRAGLKIILPEDIDSKIGNLTNGQSSPATFQTILLEKMNTTRNLIVHTFDRNLHDESKRNEFILNCNQCYIYVKLIIDSIHKIIVEYDNKKPENEN